MTDPLLQMLENLPQAEPDSRRAERVRRRCHTALTRRARRAAQRPGGARLRSIAVVTVGTGYFMESVRQALLLLGIG